MVAGIGVRSVLRKAYSPTSMIGKRMSLAENWGIATDFINFDKSVYTSVLKEGSVLYQYRIPGTNKGSYFVESLKTTPEQVGLKASEYTEIYKVTLKQDAKVLNSTHIENAPYWLDRSQTTQGGGKQIYNTEIRNTANFEQIK